VARHSGNKDQESAEQYRNFLVQSNVESVMVEFRLGDQLKMVSVVDIVSDGISAVYTFYDAGDTHASYGTYNVMWLIKWCKRLKLDYLYLGYWIKESPKMAYKQNFVPQEALIDGEWQLL
ncbi:MAG TPA: arginyltransferase, partial [Methyloradius sp.]